LTIRAALFDPRGIIVVGRSWGAVRSRHSAAGVWSHGVVDGSLGNTGEMNECHVRAASVIFVTETAAPTSQTAAAAANGATAHTKARGQFRFAFGVQAVADGLGFTGAMLFAVAATSVGAPAQAAWGMLLVLMGGVLHGAVTLFAARRLRRRPRRWDGPGEKWLYGLVVADVLSLTLGFALVAWDLTPNLVAAAVSFGLAFLGSLLFVRSAVRAVIDGTVFVDSATLRRYA
jgi:hypothetical protein